MPRQQVLLISTSDMGWPGVCSSLKHLPDIEAVAETNYVDEAMRVAAKHPPDLVVAPADLDGEPPLDLLAAIRHHHAPTCRFVIITWRLDDLNQFQDFLTLGVSGYFLWEELNSITLLIWFGGIAQGAMVLGPAADEAWQGMQRSRLCLLGKAPVLSPRESEILRMLANGAHRDEIESALCISEKTFYRDIEALKARLGARTRDQLLVKATLLGLIP